jgi:hypothetical protein
MSLVGRCSLARALVSATLLSALVSAQASELSESATEQIKQACETLVMDYARHRDQSRGVALAQLFTQDAELSVNGETFTGRKALLARFEAPAAKRFRHMMSNVQITVTGHRQATGVSYALIFVGPIDARNPDAPITVSNFVAMGEYHDIFVLTDAGWRIASRRFVPAFLVDAQ